MTMTLALLPLSQRQKRRRFFSRQNSPRIMMTVGRVCRDSSLFCDCRAQIRSGPLVGGGIIFVSAAVVKSEWVSNFHCGGACLVETAAALPGHSGFSDFPFLPFLLGSSAG